MSIFLRAFEFLSLSIWLGSDVFLSFVVAPGAFSVLATRDQAGAIEGYAGADALDGNCLRRSDFAGACFADAEFERFGGSCCFERDVDDYFDGGFAGGGES